MASDEFSYGKIKETDAKYFIDYKNDKKLDHYSSHSHKKSGCLKRSVQINQYMFYKMKNEKLQYKWIWNKISITIKKIKTDNKIIGENI